MGTIKNRCVIVGGGDCSPELLKSHITENDFVICADSGYDIASESSISTDLLIGDFDSIKTVPQDVNTISLPVEKDVTDCVAAYNEGVKLGFESFILFGGTGGRFEHTFSNISLMANASVNGHNFEIVDDRHFFRCITNSSVNIMRKVNQQVSVFAYGSKAYGVTLSGFHYKLDNYTLDPFDGALGTSNDITEEFGTVSVTHGTVIIIETLL